MALHLLTLLAGLNFEVGTVVLEAGHPRSCDRLFAADDVNGRPG